MDPNSLAADDMDVDENRDATNVVVPKFGSEPWFEPEPS